MQTREDMAFAASDPLSELVWSPHNGLSLKRTNRNVSDKKPFLLWNVGPSSKDLSPSQSIRSKGSEDGNAADQENLMISRTVLNADDLLGNEATLDRPSISSHTPELRAIHGDYDDRESNSMMEEEGGTKDAIPKTENCTDDEEVDLCRPQNVQIGSIAEVSKNDAGLNTSAEWVTDYKVDSTVNGLFSTELIRKTHCIKNSNIEVNASCNNIMDLEVCSLPNLQSEKKPDDEVTSSSGKVNKNKINISIPIPAPPLKKLEFSAENDLCHLTAEEAGETNSGVCLYREKGKEKALSMEISVGDHRIVRMTATRVSKVVIMGIRV
ncbi:hypothetical protein DH2020_019856 [Rehmannia glutinosa]|uniref:Uncharacterized protein n=1 Tax=Rehmannia glutinosa TaxID=99300 RepID=A0ABR0WEY7_REHGL